ncbi:MAG: MarR family transcriptional regulator [Ignavibacteriales bacterium]
MELEKEIQQTSFSSIYHKMALNILFTAHWMEYHNACFLKSWGITPQQFNILRILRGQHPKPASVNLLIERMLDKMSNASRLVEKLRVKGLVSRQECLDDRRQVDVLITGEGLALLKEIDATMDEQQKFSDMLTESEAVELNRLLEKLRG